MSQNTARHDPRAKSGDEDVAEPRARQPEPKRSGPIVRPVGQPADDESSVSPDEPDEDEFPLIGDNDLGAADLGPADPNASDPDAGSGRIRKIARQTGRA
jgi:hypothetical protein